MERAPLVVAGTAALLVLGGTGAASAAPPTPGGCQAFGANVALLGQDLGRDFGAAASTAATSGPRAFPTLIVFPEQAALCP